MTTNLGRYIHHGMISTWVDFGEIQLETLFWAFFFKFRVCFFKVKHLAKHSVGQMNRKCINWILDNYVALIFTSPMSLTLKFSRSNFEMAVSQELLVWLIWLKKEVSQLHTGLTAWPCPLKRGGNILVSLTLSVRLSVCSSVCRTNRVGSVSSTILARSIQC